MNLPSNKSLDFLGRLCLSTTFAIAIPTKILDFQLFLNAIIDKGIPAFLASVLLLIAIACMFGGVGFLLFGNDQRVGASLLLIFIIPTTIIMHFFPFQTMAVFMNLGLIGGLIIAIIRPLPKRGIGYTKEIEQLHLKITEWINLSIWKIKELIGKI